MELRRFWLLSDLLEKSPSAKELRRGGFCGGNGADIFILFSVSPSPSPSAACSSMLTNDGMEALAQSLRRRYLPLSMMLMLSVYRLIVKRCKYYAILIKPLCVRAKSKLQAALLCPNCCQVGVPVAPTMKLQLPDLPLSLSLSQSGFTFTFNELHWTDISEVISRHLSVARNVNDDIAAWLYTILVYVCVSGCACNVESTINSIIRVGRAIITRMSCNTGNGLDWAEWMLGAPTK